jgi:hypothetical protein
MITREKLDAELNRPLDPTTYHWDMPIILAYSCKGVIEKAHEFFNESHNHADLLRWRRAIDRAEEYVKAKDAHFYGVRDRITGNSDGKDKTNEHTSYIAMQREATLNAEWQSLIAAITSAKYAFEQAKNETGLKQWKSAVDAAEVFLQARCKNSVLYGDTRKAHDKAQITEHTKNYQDAAKKYYLDKPTCSLSCWSFICCTSSAAAVEEKSDKEESYLDTNGASYSRMLD